MGATEIALDSACVCAFPLYERTGSARSCLITRVDAAIDAGTPDQTAAPTHYGCHFDRATDERLQAPHNAAQNLNGTSAGWAISVWLYLDQLPSLAGGLFYALDKGGSATGSDWVLLVSNVDDKAVFYYRNNAGSPVSSQCKSAALSATTWYHLIFSFDGVNTVSIYNMTTSVTTTKTPVAEPIHGTEDLRFGGNNGELSSRAFDGIVWNLQIFNRALTSAERTALHNSGVGSIYPHDTSNNLTYNTQSFWDTIRGYWPLGDDPTVGLYRDYSGHDNHLLAAGSPTQQTTHVVGVSNCTRLDGANDYLYRPEVGFSRSARLPRPDSTPMFVSMWVKINTLPSAGGSNFILSQKIDTTTGRGWEAYILTADDSVGMKMRGNGDSRTKNSAPDAVVASEWYHFVFVYDPAGVNFILYVDGGIGTPDLAGKYTLTLTTDPGMQADHSVNPFTIGCSHGLAKFCAMDVQNVSLHKGLPTDAQILGMWNGHKGFYLPSPIAVTAQESSSGYMGASYFGLVTPPSGW